MRPSRVTITLITFIPILSLSPVSHLFAQDTSRVVANLTGAWGPNPALVEEVRIGESDGSDPFLFGRIVDVAVGEDDKIWVADGMASEIRVFNPDGSHAFTVGREGEGPGEYRMLAAVAFLPDGRLAVYDDGPRAVTLLTSDGEFILRTRMPKRFVGGAGNLFEVDDLGRYYLLEKDRERPGRPYVYLRLDETGEILDTLRIPPRDRNGPRRGGKSYSFGAMAHFTEMTFSHLSPVGELVAGRNDRYHLFLPQPGGGVVEVEKEWDPIRVKRKERAEAQALTDHFAGRWGEAGKKVPGQKPPYWGFWVDDEGRVWVALHGEGSHFPETEEERARRERWNNPPSEWWEDLAFDVFDPTGRFLGTLRPENRLSRPVASKGRQLWMIEADALGVQQVVRYRITGG